MRTPRSPRIAMVGIEPVSARGLKRAAMPGIALMMGGRAAAADMWVGRDGLPVVRFKTAIHRHWFRPQVRPRLDWQSIPVEEWADFLAESLLDWLGDAIDGEFD